MFDLDGTLVDSDEFDGRLYVQAVQQVLGEVEMDNTWRRYRHVTDAGVLAQLIEEHCIPDAARVELSVHEVFGSLVQAHLASGGSCEPIPGAKDALEDLKARGCKVGIATGGWRHTALMKLQYAGIPIEGLALASSDDGVDRVQIMNTCLLRLGGDAANVMYVGDAFWDLEATQRAGWKFLGIGKKLQGRCERWIADFTDPAWRSMRDAHVWR